VLINILSEFKYWWFGQVKEELEEINRLESKHTRVHYDIDIHELIRIH